MLLPALGFRGFAGSLSGLFSLAFLAFPPLDKKIAGTFVPDIAVAYAFERDEIPHASVLTNFFDDADAFPEGHRCLYAMGFARENQSTCAIRPICTVPQPAFCLQLFLRVVSR